MGAGGRRRWARKGNGMLTGQYESGEKNKEVRDALGSKERGSDRQREKWVKSEQKGVRGVGPVSTRAHTSLLDTTRD